MTTAAPSKAIEKSNGNGAKPAPLTLKAFLEGTGAKAKLGEVATKIMKPEDLVRLALMAASRQPDLLKCSHTSILRALMDAAALGIAPGGVMGRGYLVPRKNKKTGELECCFDPGWRGLCDVARRDTRVKKIDAKVVYEGDVFEYEEGTSQTLRHVPTLTAQERGKVVAAYAIAKVEDELQIEVLTLADIEKIRKVSMAQSGPWSNWYEEMARKSAVRRLCKYLPYNPQLEKALEHATDVESGVRTTFDVTTVGDKPAPRTQALAASVAAKTAALKEPEPPAESEADVAERGEVEPPEAAEQHAADDESTPEPDEGDDLGGRM